MGRSEDGLAAAAADLRGRAVTVCGDVALPRTNQRAVAAAVQRFGRLDAVVGNAGVTLAKSVDETTEPELEHLLGVNLKALVHMAQAAHGALGQTRGSFIVMASNKGLVAQRGSPVYVATKGAANELARALALDWAPGGSASTRSAPDSWTRACSSASSRRSRTPSALGVSWPPSSPSGASRARASARTSRSSSPHRLRRS